MYEQIASNQRKTWALISFFFVIIVLLGYVLGFFWGDPYVGIAAAIVIGMVFTLFSYFKGDKVVLKLSHAKPASKKQYPHLVNTVEGLAIAAGIPAPKIYVIEEEAINAFATGRNPEHAAITVTTGALKKLNRTELEGVVGHEMAHIKNYDIKVMMLTVMLVGIIALLSDVILRSFFYGRKSRNSKGNGGAIILVVGLILAILTPIIAQMVKLAISRKREYLADASGALLTRHPAGLAEALTKIKNDKAPQMAAANKATAHLFIYNPLKKKTWLNNMFSTHPPVDERIKRLKGM